MATINAAVDGIVLTADATTALNIQSGGVNAIQIAAGGATTIPTLSTSGSTISSGNLAFTGTGQRITGDFSNATVANRVMFQSSTTNGNTDIALLPNGTSTTSIIRVLNGNDLTAGANSIGLFSTATEGSIRAAFLGGPPGTIYLPMTFYTGNSERARIDTSGNVGIGTASPSGRLHVSAGTQTALNLQVATGGYAWLLGTSGYTGNASVGFIDDGGSGGLGINQYDSGGAYVRRAVTLSSSGNVGIGKTPTAGRLLDVNGDAWVYDVRVGRGGSAITSNTAVGGADTLYANTTGSSNTAVGYNSLPVNTTGYGNTAIGRSALEGNTTGNFNTAVGAHVPGSVGGPLQSNTTGGANTAVGVGAMFGNTSGTDNVAVGYLSQYAKTTGSYSTSVGSQALRNVTTANYNTAVGFASLYSATTGAGNNGFGFYSGYGITTGNGNNCIGYYAGFSLTTGNYNVIIGEQAAYYSIATTTGFHNTYIGGLVRGSAATNNNEIVIGYDTAGKGSSTGLINPAGGSMYQGNNTTTWATTSDRRIKKNIVDNNDGLAKINQLRVRNFEYRTEDEIDPELPKSAAIKTPGVQLGVIAQEIREVLPECVKQESTGVLSVNSDRLIWHLVNAVKELSAEVNALKAKLGE